MFEALVGAVSIATIVLFFASFGKWSDAIIDSGREWIVPDVLSRGELLYRDVVYWFGPFTPYFHAALFSVFGSSFRTLVLAGVIGSLGIALALYVVLRRFAGRIEAALWTGMAIAVLLFMPNAGGAVLGMGFRMWHAAAFSLLAVAISASLPTEPAARRIAVAGALCGLAGLCRTEWGLGAVAASLVAIAVRRGIGRRFARNAAVLTVATAATFGIPLALLAFAAGPSALLSDAPVLLVGIPEITRRNVLRLGDGVVSGLAALLYSSAMWLGAFLVVEAIATWRRDRRRLRRRAPMFLGVTVVLALAAAAGGTSGAVAFNAAPLACAMSIAVGIAGAPRPRAAALAGFGVAGVLFSHRRLFHLTDAPYVGPPLLFAVVCAAILLRLAVMGESERGSRERLRSALRAAIAILVVLAFAGRLLEYRSDDRVRVPGIGGVLSAHPDVVRDIVTVAAVVRRNTCEGDGLVVFPEGEVLNYLAARRNPIRHKLYLPGYVDDRNEAEIVRELERAKPAAVVIWNRGTGEYGPNDFGHDYARAIRAYIAANYVPRTLVSRVDGRSRVFVAFRNQARTR